MSFEWSSTEKIPIPNEKIGLRTSLEHHILRLFLLRLIDWNLQLVFFPSQERAGKRADTSFRGTKKETTTQFPIPISVLTVSAAHDIASLVVFVP